MIGPEVEAQILRLHEAEKWPPGTIATQLGLDRKVVLRVLRQRGVRGPGPCRASMIDPYVPFIRRTLEKYPTLPASRLYAMCRERGYPGQPAHFRARVRPYRPRKKAEAFLCLRTLPGEEAQVDWAHFGRIQIGTAQRPLVAFAMVLSWSRAIFVRFFLNQVTETFLCGHVGAFRAFGGVPRRVLYDNLKSVVLRRAGAVIEYSPAIIDFSKHHRYEPLAVGVRRANEKGRVERAIRYVRTSFFAGRTYADLADLNRQADQWCQGTATERRHREEPTLTVAEALERERAKLLALPDTPYPTEETKVVTPRKTPYVRFDLNDYSVPHDRIRRALTVLADQDTVRILDGTDEVARHARCWDRGQRIEDPAHLERLQREKRQARRGRGLDRLGRAAPSSQKLLAEAVDRGLNLGNAVGQLLKLLDLFGPEALERAIQEALRHGTPHPHAVRHVLEREAFAQGTAPPVPVDLTDERLQNLVVRPHPLASYDSLTSPDSEESA